LKAVAGAIESNATAHQKLLDSADSAEEREYISYIDAVKEALNRRDSMQIQYDMTVDELTKRRTEKEQVSYNQDNRIVNRLYLLYFI
jgi:sorting nexin-7/30